MLPKNQPIRKNIRNFFGRFSNPTRFSMLEIEHWRLFGLNFIGAWRTVRQLRVPICTKRYPQA